MQQCSQFPCVLANFLQPLPCWMRILDCVKRQFAIANHSSKHICEFMNQFAGEPYRFFVIRILKKGLFILVFVLRQKTHSCFRNRSLRRNFDCVAVRVTHEKCLAKVEHSHVIRDNARRYKLHSCCTELGRRSIYIWCQQNCLSMDKVVRVLINWKGAPITRAQVLQEFDSGPGRGAQRGDSEMSAEHIIKVFLLGSVVFALSSYSQAEQVAVEPEAGIRVRYGDGRVIDSEKQTVSVAMPLWISLALWKLEDFNRV